MTQPAPIAVHKDPRKQQAILDAATEVFAKVGFQNTDVQVIAERAGVGKGTVYRYFGSKEDLFLAAADAGMRKLSKRMHQAVEGARSTVDLFWRAGLAYAEFFQEHPELVEIMIQERAQFQNSIPSTHLVYRDKYRGIPEEVLRRGIEAGEIRPIDVREAGSALANALYGTVVCGCLEGSSDRLVRMAEPAIEVFLRGILVDPDAARRRGAM
jgi:AcrR family transcriptional regulator